MEEFDLMLRRGLTRAPTWALRVSMGRAGSVRARVMINVGKRARAKMQILRTVSGVHCLSAQRTNGADEQCSRCSVCQGQSGVREGSENLDGFKRSNWGAIQQAPGYIYT